MKKIIASLLLCSSYLVNASELTLDVTFDQDFHLPYITFNIADEQPLLTLDTGSKNGLHLPIELIDKITNKTELPVKQKSIDFAGNISESRQFIIENLPIGPLVFKHIDTLEYHHWGFYLDADDKKSAELEIHPYVIGLSFFNDHVLTLDFAESKITIAEEDHTTNDSATQWQSLPFQLAPEGIVVEMADSDKNYRLILDTGASISMLKVQSLTPQSVLSSEDGYQFVSINVNGITDNKVNALVLDTIPDEFTADGLLGMDFLNNNVVKIDLKNKQLWLKSQ